MIPKLKIRLETLVARKPWGRPVAATVLVFVAVGLLTWLVHVSQPTPEQIRQQQEQAQAQEARQHQEQQAAIHSARLALDAFDDAQATITNR
jgi:hypothetical protein